MKTEKIDWLSVFDHTVPFASGLVMVVWLLWFGLACILWPSITVASPDATMQYGWMTVLGWAIAGALIHLWYGMAAMHPDSDRLVRQRYVMCAMGYTLPLCIPFIKKMWAAR